MTTDKFKSELKDVIERNLDASKGFAKAAQLVKNENIASSFEKQATLHKNFALELESSANVYEDNVRQHIESGTFEGNLHRTWMDIKTFFSNDKDELIVEECIRGQKEALNEYDEVISHDYVPEPVNSILRNQRDQVLENIYNLEKLEHILD